MTAVILSEGGNYQLLNVLDVSVYMQYKKIDFWVQHHFKTEATFWLLPFQLNQCFPNLQ